MSVEKSFKSRKCRIGVILFAFRVWCRNIDTGLFWSNNPLIDNDAISFGGIKKSGIGRELGKVGLDTFRRTKMVVIDPEQKIHDWWYPYTKKQLREI